MGFLGLDVIAVKALSRELAGFAREVDALQKELTALIHQTEWIGADQKKFVEDWSSAHRPGLIRGRELLDEASRLALDGAKQQERVSNSGGGGTSGGGSGGGGGRAW